MGLPSTQNLKVSLDDKSLAAIEGVTQKLKGFNGKYKRYMVMVTVAFWSALASLGIAIWALVKVVCL